MSHKNPYRVAFIGDVHGHADEFEEMIVKLEQYGVDRIISLGDLFDRGPDAPRCLRIVKDRGFKARSGERRDIEMIMGNHEDRNIRCWRKIPIPGGYSDQAPRPVSPREFREIKDHEWEWLEQRPFTIRIKERGLNLCAVHGGFLPKHRSPFWYGFDKGGEIARVRSDGGEHWARGYDGRFGRVIYGHTSFTKPLYSNHAVGLDGSKYGRLFGLVVSNHEEDHIIEIKFKGWSRASLSPVESPTAINNAFDRAFRRSNRSRSSYSSYSSRSSSVYSSRRRSSQRELDFGYEGERYNNIHDDEYDSYDCYLDDDDLTPLHDELAGHDEVFRSHGYDDAPYEDEGEDVGGYFADDEVGNLAMTLYEENKDLLHETLIKEGEEAFNTLMIQLIKKDSRYEI